MEFSQIFGFLKILGESIKQFFKNIKVIAPITAVSLLLSSILLLLLSLVYQFAIDYFTNSSPAIFFLQIIFPVFIFTIVFTFLFAYNTIADASWIAAVIATATSCAGSSELSLGDVYASVKTKRRSLLRNNFRRPRDPMHVLWLITAAVAIVVVMKYPSPVTVTLAGVVGIATFVAYLNSSVVWTLAAVILVVEDDGEAAEKAEKLVEGQRLDGFMVNLFFYLLCLIYVLGFWLVVGDQGSLNLPVYGLFFVNSIVLTRIFVSVIYTVYYFRCKQFHAEQIDYAPLINDVP